MAGRRNSAPPYRHRQKSNADKQQLKEAAQAKLPWVLAGLGLTLLLLLAVSGLLWYRASRPLAGLVRMEGVVSWVQIRRSSLRPHPYQLRFATHQKAQIWEVYIGQNEERAAYYTQQLRVGDSVRVYYNEDAAKGSPLVYQLEKAGQVLLAAESTQADNKIGAIGFGVLGLLLLALCFLSPQLRTAIKSYFRGHTA